ncbi:MAG: thiamine-phosphate kinase, partial [Alphaproteobacteria bacterium]|nr:thiamine-phosphate kinase [Alphaproteobacteria bacterium]
MSREDDLIEKYFAPLAGPAGLGLRDDAALLSPASGMELVITVDALAAGTHFLSDDAPEAIARKALRVNISDLAAKGSEPAGFVLALALPLDESARPDGEWMRRFAQALGEDAAHYRCPLAGGDTVSISGPLTLSITA